MSWEGVDPAKWAGSSTAALTALLRLSVQALASEMAKTIPNGGNVPVKTGNLGRSVMVDDKPPAQDTETKVRKAQQDISGGIAAIAPGKDVFIGYQAKYARRLNYGFVGTDSLGRTYNQSGYGFVEAAAAKWPAIVAEQGAKLRNR